MIKNTDLLPAFLVPYIIDSFEYKGYKCFVAKHEIEEGKDVKMHWFCGYALIDKNVPFFNVTEDIDVHGGVTFNQAGIVGFDCNHVGDDNGYFKPAYLKWDVDKVKQEIMKMVDSYLELRGGNKMKMLIDCIIGIVAMNLVFIGSFLIADGAQDGPTAKIFFGINIIVIAIFGTIILGEIYG